MVHHAAPAPQSAILEQCVTSSATAERAATFAGEMSAVPGSVRMEMRIDVLEKAPKKRATAASSTPGLGVWRSSAPGAEVLSLPQAGDQHHRPAAYRGLVRFRWFNAKGRQISFANSDQAVRTDRGFAPLTASGATLD